MNRIFLLYGIVLIIFPLDHLLSQEQRINVKLVSSDYSFPGPRISQPLLFTKGMKAFKGVDRLGSEYYVGEYVLDERQYYHDGALSGRFKPEFAQKVRDIYQIKAENQCIQEAKSFLGVLVAWEENIKYVILDADNNHDFSNDSIYAFNSLDTTLTNRKMRDYYLYPSIPISYEHCINAELITLDKVIKFSPFNDGDWNHPNLEVERKQIYIGNGRLKTGSFRFNNSTYEIYVAFTGQSLYETKERAQILIKSVFEPYDITKWKTSTKNFLRDRYTFKLEKLDEGAFELELSVEKDDAIPLFKN